MANNLVPNSFQCPNFLIDRLDYYLTPAETKVLIKAVREILGWNDKIPLRKNAIGLSIFVKGKPKKEVLGCGLGIGSVREALESLDKFHILVKVGLPTQDGQTYWLQDDETKIDWEALKARRDGWDKVNRNRTQQATIKSLESRGVTSDVTPNVGRNTSITSDVTRGVTSDVNKETQHETQHETQKGPAQKAPPVPSAGERVKFTFDERSQTTLEEMAGAALQPPARDYLTDVFNGNTNGVREGEHLIRRAKWDIHSQLHCQAMAAFLEASRLSIPRKKDQGDWIDSVDAHLHICGGDIDILEKAYPLIIAQMRGDGLTVSRPGSVTNNLADWWAKEKNGGTHARPEPPQLDDHQKRIGAALKARARNAGG